MKKIISLLRPLVFIMCCASAEEVNTQFDDQLAKQAPTVLRVKYISFEGANKYAVYKANVLKVFKNTSGVKLDDQIIIFSYSWKQGLPEGESTVYLEPIETSPQTHWKLLGGDAINGVSHSSN